MGGWGWVLSAGVVPAAVDAVAIRRHALGCTVEAHTMSRSYLCALRHPIRKWPVWAATGALLWHLSTGWNPLARLGDLLIERWSPTQGRTDVTAG